MKTVLSARFVGLVLALGVLFSSLYYQVRGQTTAPAGISPDPAALAIALTTPDMPAGFRLVDEGARQYTVAGGMVYNALSQMWSNSQLPYSPDRPAEIRCFYGVLPTRDLAKQFFHKTNFLQSNISQRDDHLVGEITLGVYPRISCFFQGRAFAEVCLAMPKDKGELPAIHDRLVARVLDKIRAQGIQPGPPLSFEFNVVSGHVHPHKEQSVVVDLTASEYPVSYGISISREQDEGVVFETGVKVQGQYKFVWDGMTPQGQAGHGSYTLSVRAVDEIGRSVEKTTTINVNGSDVQRGGDGGPR